MYGRRVRCTSSGAVGHFDQAATRQAGHRTSRKHLLLWSCAAASLALTAQALAQSTTLPQVTVEGKGTTAKKSTSKGAPKAAPQQPAEPVQQVETQASKEKAQKDAVYNTPAAVSTATKSELDTFGQIDTGDVIRAMPGTSTRESPQNAGLAVNIRGFEGSGRVNMMIDGVRQNFRFTGHEAQGFVYVDPALLAGVDIARGAVSTAGGAGALAGAANLRTLGVDDIIKPGNATGVLSTVTYGTNHVGFQEMVGAGARAGAVGIAGAISHREPDDYKNGDGVTVPGTRQDLVSGLVKMDIAISSEQSLKFGGVFYDNDFFANSYEQNIKSETYTAKYAYKPRNNPLIDFGLNLSANSVRMQYFHDSTPLSGAPGTNPLGASAGRVIRDIGLGFDATNTSRFNIGAVRVAATYGVEYFHDDASAINKDPLNAATAGGVNPAGESQIASAFSQTKYSYGIFDLISGLRYDTYKLDGVFDAKAGNPAMVPVGTYILDQEDGRLSPKITLAAQALPWLQPYVTYSEAFRAPTINETMLGGSHPDGGGVGAGGITFSPNPFLKPEVQKGWEFGANIKQNGLFTPRDAFRLKAAYYMMDIENYITGFGTTNIIFRNVPGTSEAQGVELEGSYDAGVVFAGLSYTYTDMNIASQLNGTGSNSIPPEHTIVATAGVRLLDQKLTLGGRVSHFSETNVGAANAGTTGCCAYATPIMPGYTLVDLFANYKVSEVFGLGLTVSNLFDVDYTPALSTPNVPGGAPFTINPTNCFGSNHVGCNDSGRGRTVLFTAKSHF